MKKTICLVTDWYPTKDNPYVGVFFKEQAFLVKDEFDYIVARYREHITIIPRKSCKVSVLNIENNTKEYLLNVNVSLVAFLADEIHDFIIKHFKRNMMVEGVGRYISNCRKKFIRKTLIDVFTKEISEKPDVFYCVDAQYESFYLQCLSEHFNKPYIVGEHAPVPWPGSVISDVNISAIEKADMFLAISNDKIRQLLMQNVSLPKTVYLGNMVDETKLKLESKRNDTEKTFIIVAANSFYKNYSMFVEVMEKLKDSTRISFNVMIVGYAANKGYSKNVEAFENRIKSSKIAECTELIPEVAHDRIGEVLSRADAFVMTSIQEGQPVSAMEAACCGLPIFSTRCGGVEDYVNDRIGRVYSITDVDGMVQGLKDYLEGNIQFDSEYIRKTVVNLFGRNAFSDKFCEAVNKVILSYDRA